MRYSVLNLYVSALKVLAVMVALFTLAIFALYLIASDIARSAAAPLGLTALCALAPLLLCGLPGGLFAAFGIWASAELIEVWIDTARDLAAIRERADESAPRRRSTSIVNTGIWAD